MRGSPQLLMFPLGRHHAHQRVDLVRRHQQPCQPIVCRNWSRASCDAGDDIVGDVLINLLLAHRGVGSMVRIIAATRCFAREAPWSNERRPDPDAAPDDKRDGYNYAKPGCSRTTRPPLFCVAGWVAFG